MTETVILALIALIVPIAFFVTVIVSVKMVLKAEPAHFELQTKHGHVKVDFDSKADE